MGDVALQRASDVARVEDRVAAEAAAQPSTAVGLRRHAAAAGLEGRLDLDVDRAVGAGGVGRLDLDRLLDDERRLAVTLDRDLDGPSRLHAAVALTSVGGTGGDLVLEGDLRLASHPLHVSRQSVAEPGRQRSDARPVGVDGRCRGRRRSAVGAVGLDLADREAPSHAVVRRERRRLGRAAVTACVRAPAAVAARFQPASVASTIRRARWRPRARSSGAVAPGRIACARPSASVTLAAWPARVALGADGRPGATARQRSRPRASRTATSLLPRARVSGIVPCGQRSFVAARLAAAVAVAETGLAAVAGDAMTAAAQRAGTRSGSERRGCTAGAQRNAVPRAFCRSSSSALTNVARRRSRGGRRRPAPEPGGRLGRGARLDACLAASVR